jgi:hypothetical protein
LSFCDINGCESGYAYFLDPNTNLSFCQQCCLGCIDCTSNDISSCTSCLHGYFLAPNINVPSSQTCYPCISNCYSCINSVKCKSCNQGYELNVDFTLCVKSCNSNCLTCDSNNLTKCLSCYNNAIYNPLTSTCDLNISCNKTKNCTACPDNYVLVNSTCFNCTFSTLNCAGCSYSNLGQCSQCSKGYYLISGLCLPCPTGCDFCLNSQSCLTCIDGYYLATILNNSLTGAC